MEAETTPENGRLTMGTRLQINSINKSFGVVQALKNVSLDIGDNEVVGLVGENGAGKSTLLKVISGSVTSDSGSYFVAGAEQKFTSISDSRKAGIAMVYQEQSLLQNINIAENIFLGIEGDSVKYGIIFPKKIRAKARHYLDQVSLKVNPKSITEASSFGIRQMIEIAKALAVAEFSRKPPILLLDEPTSVLSKDEVEILFSVIRKVKKGTSVVFVSHRLDEVLAISDRVFVMRDGQVVAEVDPKNVSVNELFALMVGKDLSASYFQEELVIKPMDQKLLEVKDMSGDNFRNVSFDLKKGEILSILGLQNSGRENLARVIFGALKKTKGEMFLEGTLFKNRNTSKSVSDGVGYVPSERKLDGIVLAMNVGANLSLTHPGRVTRSGFFSDTLIVKLFKLWADKLNIKAPSSKTSVKSLSGGNQQKIVLAKWLMDPSLKLLILDTPTRGLDVGAKTEIYRIMRELASKGIGIILLADSLEEGIFMGHKVITMKDGLITASFASDPGIRPERTEILAAMS